MSTTPLQRSREAIALLKNKNRSKSDKGVQREEKKLSLGGHLLELKRRVIYLVIALVVATSVAFFYAEPVFRLLLRPIDHLLQQPDGNVEIVFTKVTEMIGTQFMLSFVMGLVVTLPFILYQVVMFVSPALFPREKRYIYSIMPGALLAFAAGAIFAYFVLLPPMLKFLVTFGADIARPMLSIGAYVSLFTRLVFWIGICFEAPMVVFILARIGILNGRMLKNKWRWSFIGAFVLGAIITPTFDPINQTLVAIPLLALYWISVGLAYLAQSRRKKAQAAAEAVESD